jgi:hypothetical protein
MFRSDIAIAIAICITIPCTALGQTRQWLCIGEKATGFHFKNSTNSWEYSIFSDIQDKKFIIRQSSNSGSLSRQLNMGWIAVELGTNIEHQCSDSHIYFTRPQQDLVQITCNVFMSSLRFDSRTLRFLVADPIGYIDGHDDGRSTPHIMIGRCSPF